MNKVIILAAFFFGISSSVNAQLRTNTTSQTAVIKTDKEKLEAYKSHLDALNTKEAWIRSNPEEFKIATKNGWFDNATKTRKELKEAISKIENKNK